LEIDEIQKELLSNQNQQLFGTNEEYFEDLTDMRIVEQPKRSFKQPWSNLDLRFTMKSEYS